MNLTKKQIMIAAIVVGAVAVWYFFIRKKKMESSYDDLLLIGSESGYGPEYGAYGNYGNESGYGPEYGAYGSYGYETGYDGSNVGQMCKKDRHCTPGLVCDKGRCVDKRKGQTGGIKPPPTTTYVAMPVPDVKPGQTVAIRPYMDKVLFA